MTTTLKTEQFNFVEVKVWKLSIEVKLYLQLCALNNQLILTLLWVYIKQQQNTSGSRSYAAFLVRQ